MYGIDGRDPGAVAKSPPGRPVFQSERWDLHGQWSQSTQPGSEDGRTAIGAQVKFKAVVLEIVGKIKRSLVRKRR